MMSVLRLTIFALVVLPILGGCGAVPQPFRGGPKITHDNPLLDVPAATGVALLPVTGLPQALSESYTQAVAERLDTMEIPAAAVPKAGSLGFLVSGVATSLSQDATGQRFDVAWTVKSRHGAIVGHFVQTVRVSAGDDGARSASALTARSIAAAMGLGPEPSQAEAAPAAPALPSISVKPVEGAHGDGRTSLALAVLQALSDAGARRDDVNPDVVLFTKVDTQPAGFDTQNVTISWRAVLRNGGELGTVKVENTIPVGTLDGAWGPTAFSIAAAAQKNLLQLIGSAPRS